MKWPGCSDLRVVREQLGKSQSEFAAMLGISVRAVQSYEQGWRGVPVGVRKLAALFYYFSWRSRQGYLSPCWEAMDCDPAIRKRCAVHQLRAGEFCWLFNGYEPTPRSKRVATCEGVKRPCDRCLMTQCWVPRS